MSMTAGKDGLGWYSFQNRDELVLRCSRAPSCVYGCAFVLRLIAIAPILVAQQQRHVCRGPLAELWYFQAPGGWDFWAGV